MTSLGNQGVQTTRKDNQIIWNEGWQWWSTIPPLYITRILRVLHIAIHYPLPAAKIRGPKILEVSPCSD
jgi:hypothetical protein